MAYKRYKIDTTQFDFSCALKLLKRGHYVVRIIDVERQIFYKITKNEQGSNVIVKCYYNGDLKPHTEKCEISEDDLLANDWIEVFL